MSLSKLVTAMSLLLFFAIPAADAREPRVASESVLHAMMLSHHLSLERLHFQQSVAREAHLQALNVLAIQPRLHIVSPNYRYDASNSSSSQSQLRTRDIGGGGGGLTLGF
jgi:hypothetical protein